MNEKLQKKLVKGQAITWALSLIGNAIVLCVLDNWEGRFTFANVAMFSMLSIIVFSAVAQGQIRQVLAQVNASESDDA